MNIQEVFNIAVARLRDGKGQCTIREDDDENPLCGYRGRDGNRCVVGALIPDKIYFPSMEGMWLADVINAVPALRHLRDELKQCNLGRDILLYFLTDLQKIHDAPENWRNSGGVLNPIGEDERRVLAEAHGLDYTPPTNQGKEHR
jgi:hypothetical protein